MAEMVREFCCFADRRWMSANKDSLVNIWGWLAVNDEPVRGDPQPGDRLRRAAQRGGAPAPSRRRPPALTAAAPTGRLWTGACSWATGTGGWQNTPGGIQLQV